MPDPSVPTNPSIDELLDRCPPAQRGRFIGRLKGLRRKPSGEHRAKIERSIMEDLSRAIEGYERRKANVPSVSYPEDLPVSQRREEIIGAIREN
ncbi:MAG: hypothetical protein ACF8LL_12610, partial [Phycisphaerales bacterium]